MADADTMSEAFELPWSRRELWTLTEAACLLSGVEPISEKDSFQTQAKASAKLATIYRDLKDATIKGTIKYIDPFGGWVGHRRLDPRACIAWAKAKGFKVPEHLAELPEPAGFHFDSDNPNYPGELDAAVIVWRAATNRPNSNLNPKEQIRRWLEKLYPDFPNEAKERIATMCNWDKKGGRPKSS